MTLPKKLISHHSFHTHLHKRISDPPPPKTHTNTHTHKELCSRWELWFSWSTQRTRVNRPLCLCSAVRLFPVRCSLNVTLMVFHIIQFEALSSANFSMCPTTRLSPLLSTWFGFHSRPTADAPDVQFCRCFDESWLFYEVILVTMS